MVCQLRAFRFDQEVEANPLDQFENDVMLARGAQSVLEGVHDVWVPELHADGAFGWPIAADESRLEAGGLLLIQELEADDSAQLEVSGPVDLGHASLTGLAQELET